MEKKFDLKRMRREIPQDEAILPRVSRKITQEEIRERILRKRKEASGGR
jgi:hypothetical protein